MIHELRVGDWVKIKENAQDYSLPGKSTWHYHKIKTIGSIYQLKGIERDKYILGVFGFQFIYAREMLEKVEKPVETLTFKLGDLVQIKDLGVFHGRTGTISSIRTEQIGVSYNVMNIPGMFTADRLTLINDDDDDEIPPLESDSDDDDMPPLIDGDEAPKEQPGIRVHSIHADERLIDRLRREDQAKIWQNLLRMLEKRTGYFEMTYCDPPASACAYLKKRLESEGFKVFWNSKEMKITW